MGDLLTIAAAPHSRKRIPKGTDRREQQWMYQALHQANGWNVGGFRAMPFKSATRSVRKPEF
jgi:hypothetical protein